MSGRFRRGLRGALALSAVAIVGGVVHASAPAGQYTSFYLTSGCVSDAKTQLTWMRVAITPTTAPPDVGTLTLANSAAFCANAGGPDAGAIPWRLPSVNELETLVDESPHSELQGGTLTPIAIDANAFPKTPVDTPYWTSSLLAGGSFARVVYFGDGSTSTAPVSEQQSVRCVTEWVSGAPPPACPFPPPPPY
jgi:Protein of unknown function (DUF1566)